MPQFCNRGITPRLGDFRPNGVSYLGHESRRCEPNVLVNKTRHVYPIIESPPEIVVIDRVTALSGVDNALFLTGDVQNGYRMNRDFVCEISDDLIGLNSFNMPCYLLLKSGDLHTLAVSTGNIENHPISAFIRAHNGLFSGGAGHDLFELAPQDQFVDADEGRGNCLPPRIPRIRVIQPTSLNIRYITVEVSWYECDQFLYREIFYIIPVICQNGNTAKGANFAAWDDNPRTCGQKVRIPGNSTDNGTFKLADVPNRNHCGHGDGLMIGTDGYGWRAGRGTAFGGFGW